MMQHTKNKDLFGKEFFIPIQALTWKQPFGTLMLHDKIETRSWNTLHRGPVLIHLSGKPYLAHEIKEMTTGEQYRRLMDRIVHDPTALKYGQAIAVGTLVDTRAMLPQDEEMAFVKYNPLLFSHIYKDVKRIEPFTFTGAQKWKTVVDQEILEKIKYI